MGASNHPMEKPEETSGLLELLGQITPLSGSLQQRIKEQLLDQSYEKRSLILRPGEIDRRLYFIKEGFLRSFSIDENGREHTSWFLGKGKLVISAMSFLCQKPADEYIEVIKACKLQSLTWSQLQSYYADFREGNLIGRVLIEKHYMLSQLKNLLHRMATPEQRYRMLLRKHPDIEQFTTQSNIASYLSISRETLNRIRGRILRTRSHR